MKIYNKLKKDIAVKFLICVSVTGAFLLQTGCSTGSNSISHVERYRPQTAERSYMLPVKKQDVAKHKKDTSVAIVSSDVKKPAVAVKNTQMKAESVRTETAEETFSRNKAEYGIDRDDKNNKRVRKLKYGDMLTVGLYGIPEPIEVKESIDNFGCISLPLIDVIKIVGMGTSAAERKIRDAYINNGFYTDLSVVVMAMADEYFVRGEVKNPGNYPLIGDRTLLQAITSAGGYTDYAKMSKVEILRENSTKPLIFNCKKIAKRQIKDPLIQPGDIITVPRRILWK